MNTAKNPFVKFCSRSTRASLISLSVAICSFVVLTACGGSAQEDNTDCTGAIQSGCKHLPRPPQDIEAVR
jgi:hypothetical protein